MTDPNTSPGLLAGIIRSTGCVEEKLWRRLSGPAIHSRYPQWGGGELWIAAVRKRLHRAGSDCYDSTMCSSDGGALQRVAEAIDRLEADRANTDAADLTARIAAVWSMVTEMDPELARLASGYDKPR
jgi:hypothetical protein